MKRTIGIIFVFTVCLSSYAQMNTNLNCSNVFSPDILFHNPAGATYPERLQLGVGLQKLWVGIPDVTLDNWYLFYLQPLSANTAFAIKGEYFNTDYFQQGFYSLILSQKFFNDGISLGLNFNLLSYNINLDNDEFQLLDPLLAEASSINSPSFGAGIIIRPFQWIAFGGSVDHINRPNISFSKTEFTKEPVVKAGGTLHLGSFIPHYHIRVEGDEVINQVGIHQNLFSQYITLFSDYEFLEDLHQKLFAGIHFNAGSIRLSYLYQFPFGELGNVTQGSHQVTLAFSSGGFPSLVSRPKIRLDHPQSINTKTPYLPIYGEIVCKEGIEGYSIWVNGNKSSSQRYPNTKNRRVSIRGMVQDLQPGKNRVEVYAVSANHKMSKSGFFVNLQSIIDESIVDTPNFSVKRTNNRGIAVVIGITRYQSNSVHPVEYAERDAMSMKKYLVHQFGFLEDNVILLTNEKATKNALKNYFSNDGILSNMVIPGETELFVYYSGHGIPGKKQNDQSYEQYIAPFDINPDYVENTGYMLKHFYYDLYQLNAKSVITVMDACFSGLTEKGTLVRYSGDLELEPVEQTLTTPIAQQSAMFSASDKKALWNDKEKHGLFTYYFFLGLHGEADLNGNGFISVDEMGRFLEDNVSREARKRNINQKPSFNGNYNWNFVACDK